MKLPARIRRFLRVQVKIQGGADGAASDRTRVSGKPVDSDPAGLMMPLMVRPSTLPILRTLTRTAWTWLLLFALLPGVVLGGGSVQSFAQAESTAAGVGGLHRWEADRPFVAPAESPSVIARMEETAATSPGEAVDEEEGEDSYLADSEVRATALVIGSSGGGLRIPAVLRSDLLLLPACARGPPLG